jgi:hypothetical protein
MLSRGSNQNQSRELEVCYCGFVQLSCPKVFSSAAVRMSTAKSVCHTINWKQRVEGTLRRQTRGDCGEPGPAAQAVTGTFHVLPRHARFESGSGREGKVRKGRKGINMLKAGPRGGPHVQPVLYSMTFSPVIRGLGQGEIDERMTARRNMEARKHGSGTITDQEAARTMARGRNNWSVGGRRRLALAM